MKIITIANQKGGTGKTTTVINLGAEIARKKRVLIIDLDPQGNCSKTLTGGETFDFEETVSYLFDKPKVADIAKLVRPVLHNDKEVENLWVIPSDIRLSYVIETSLTKINRERILEKHLEKIAQDFDVVLLDTPPNLSLTTLNALQASELMLIVVDSGVFSLDGISPLLEAGEEIKGEQPLYRILRNKLDKRSTIINEFISEELEVIKDMVLPHSVRTSEDITQAHTLSMPLRLFKKGSPVINDYRNLARQIDEIIKI
ncbi:MULTISPECIES: ParA family protein [Vibrio harveyi group]|uniref:ParA family protein n=1 Tax=Vibrio harveyi group TaxID=717610 RepID=UPI001B844605|nr:MULTISPECIES: ParA family protein [Vibrio harveyi group]EGQ9712134.1 ParA family protein [Vibrio parahaemolyticus]EHK4736908.1 ParA family protein [Vibrio parahaemolyticus]EHM6955526.1 ParA family protein [Vibrio parahaemolyticus]EJG1355496.1 ParA family protein [Vibrio parahaemolyticus]EJG1787380.1 ParA family protein [Vibrio parahaemolyticus]